MLSIRKIFKKIRGTPEDRAFLLSFRKDLEKHIAEHPFPQTVATPARLVQSPAFRMNYAVSFAALLLVVLGGGTIAAAHGSLPGDTLYPVKTLTEKAQIALAVSPTQKAKLELAFTTEHVQEVQQLLDRAKNNPTDSDHTVAALKAATVGIENNIIRTERDAETLKANGNATEAAAVSQSLQDTILAGTVELKRRSGEHSDGVQTQIGNIISSLESKKHPGEGRSSDGETGTSTDAAGTQQDQKNDSRPGIRVRGTGDAEQENETDGSPSGTDAVPAPTLAPNATSATSTHFSINRSGGDGEGEDDFGSALKNIWNKFRGE